MAYQMGLFTNTATPVQNADGTTTNPDGSVTDASGNTTPGYGLFSSDNPNFFSNIAIIAFCSSVCSGSIMLIIVMIMMSMGGDEK
jgi:hypothetical protein